MAKQKTLDMAVERKLDTVERYEFEPIKGYPMLRWTGKRPFRGTQYFPAQLKENHGEPVNGWMNRIYWGDNLQVMSHLLKEFRGKVDLVYIDPPFDSKVEYKKGISLRGKEVENDQSGFEEKQYSDIWSNDEYLQFMYDRLVLIKELLSETGALYLHCDWHKNHLLRCICDEVFGPGNFRNEIVWAYPGREMHITNKFNAKHDTIFFVAKSASVKINMAAVSVPYDREERLKGLRRKVHLDPDGREWVWETRGQSAGQEAYKRYVDEIIEDGKALNDVWDDVQFLRGNDPSRTGYPTQKPEGLIERIINASTSPGDIVFDCFMGSGTTQAVAMKLGRRFIGADINLGAMHVTTKRLLGVAKGVQEEAPQLEFPRDGEKEKVSIFYTGFSVYNVNQYDIFRNEVEAKDLLLQALEIQPLPGNSIYDGEKDGRMVKVMPVNRIATRADLSTLVANFDYKEFDRRQAKSPNKPVEHLLIVCMGHEPDLKAALQAGVPHKLDVEIVDILRDKQDLQFKREAEAKVVKTKKGELVIEQFYPMNLLQKLSMQKETVEDWRELVESVMVDWNYDGGVFEPKLVDVPDKNELVKGNYPIPKDAGTIKVKITDLLSEALEIELR
jgi:DNA modification methylase